MKEQIKVIVKAPRRSAEPRIIPNTLEELQGIVGGHIEVVRFASDCVIICNEEGKLRGMDHNMFLMGENFVGPIIIAGTSGEDFDDIPMGYDEFVELMPGLKEADK